MMLMTVAAAATLLFLGISPTAAEAHAPTPTPTGAPAPVTSAAPTAPIVVVVTPSTSTTQPAWYKDFLVPLGAILGAFTGAVGAVIAALVTSYFLKKRADEEAREKRREASLELKVERLGLLADAAADTLAKQLEMANIRPELWTSDDAVTLRLAVRVAAGRLYARSLGVPGEDDTPTQTYVDQVRKIAVAGSKQEAAPIFAASSDSFDALLRWIGSRQAQLRDSAPEHAGGAH